MPYEHQESVKSIGDPLISVFDKFTDEVPDREQIADITLGALVAVNQAIAPLSSESKPKYKAKLIAKVGLYMLASQIDELGLDPGIAEALRIQANASSRQLDAVLPDSES